MSVSPKIRSLRTLALLALVTGGLPGCLVDSEQAAIDGQDIEAVFLHTSDIHSRLLPYVMDVGTMDQNLGLEQRNSPFGGIARLAAVIRQDRRNFPRTAYIDTGDVFQGAPIFNAFNGEIEFKAMTQLQVDAFSIGNHEFDNGAVAMVTKAVQFANFPMLGANYALGDWRSLGISPNSRIATPYTILNLHGLRVGIIGLTAMGGSHGGSAKGVVPLRTRDTIQQYVDFLRPVVDLVAIASHVGYFEDQAVIPRVEGVDLFFGGHLHIALSPPEVVQDCDIVTLEREKDFYRCGVNKKGEVDAPEKLKAAQTACEVQAECDSSATAAEKAACVAKCSSQIRENCLREMQVYGYEEKLAELDGDIASLKKRGCTPRDVLLVHSGAFLKYLGRLQVTLRQCHRFSDYRRCVGNQKVNNDWEVLGYKYTLLPVDKRLPDDPQMLQLLEPYILELSRQQQLSQVIGYAPERVLRFAQYTDTSEGGEAGAQAGAANLGDSPLGNLVTDAMVARSQVWADFAVTNSLGIRTDIASGPVDGEQMNNVFPFDNSITVMYLSGYEVQEMMDFIAQRSASRGCQPQAQVSGVSAVLNCKGCSGNAGNTCVRQTYDGEACAQKVTIGGTGRPCATDKDCATDAAGKPTGEICTTQQHPDPAQAGKKRCWMPISCTRSYRLATNDYVAHGGSGFSVLARNTTQNNLGIPLRDAATDYIVGMPACSRIPQSYQDKLKGRPPTSVITEVLDVELAKLNPGKDPSLVQSGQEWLSEMEKKAVGGNWSGADGEFKSLRKVLSDRKAALDKIDKTKITAEEKLLRQGLSNYLACTDETSDAKTGKCTGLSCIQVQECSKFQVKDLQKCQALGRIRAALRCITLPCIAASQDGRLSLIKNEGGGSINPSDPFPD